MVAVVIVEVVVVDIAKEAVTAMVVVAAAGTAKEAVTVREVTTRVVITVVGMVDNKVAMRMRRGVMANRVVDSGNSRVPEITVSREDTGDSNREAGEAIAMVDISKQ